MKQRFKSELKGDDNPHDGYKAVLSRPRSGDLTSFQAKNDAGQGCQKFTNANSKVAIDT